MGLHQSLIDLIGLTCAGGAIAFVLLVVAVAVAERWGWDD
jgi:hypothetical protein